MIVYDRQRRDMTERRRTRWPMAADPVLPPVIAPRAAVLLALVAGSMIIPNSAATRPERICRIQTVSPKQSRDVRIVSRENIRALGGGRLAQRLFRAHIMEAFSLNVASMRAAGKLAQRALLGGTAPPVERELLATLVSTLAECHY